MKTIVFPIVVASWFFAYRGMGRGDACEAGIIRLICSIDRLVPGHVSCLRNTMDKKPPHIRTILDAGNAIVSGVATP